MNKYLELVQKLKVEEKAVKRTINRNETFLTMPKLDSIGDTNNLIRVRLIPDFKTSTNTVGPFVQHTHTFRSLKDGQTLINVTCPLPDAQGHYTCPICKYAVRQYRAGTPVDREISGKKSNYMNVYVIDNPYDATQNGKVRIMKYGNQIDDIISDALNGRFKNIFGNRIFDVSATGCTFVIRCDKRGKWPDYGRSYFETVEDSAEDVKKLKEKDIDAIYESAFQIPEKLSKPQTVQEVEKILNEHILCEDAGKSEEDIEEDDIPFGGDTEESDDSNSDAEESMDEPVKAAKPSKTSKSTRATGATSNDDSNSGKKDLSMDAQMKNLLEGL